MRYLAGAVLLALPALACSPDISPTPAIEPSDLIAMLCEQVGPCCDLAQRGDSGTSCRAGLQNLLAQGAYDAQTAAECVALLGANPPETVCELTQYPTSPCQMAIRRPGDPARGKEGDGPCVGTVLPLGIEPLPGPPTAGTPAYLCFHQDSLRCQNADGAPRCVRAAGPGAHCLTDADCGADAYCRAIVSTCEPFVPVGGPCNGEVACVDEAYCSEFDRTCFAWHPPGTPCTEDEQCRSRRCEGGTCAPQVDPSHWPAFLDRYCAAGPGL